MRAVPYARLHAHIGRVDAPPAVRAWLLDKISLTKRLMARCRHFRVRCLSQRRASSLADEFDLLGFARRMQVHRREVLLECDGTPVVFARTVVPLSATVPGVNMGTNAGVGIGGLFARRCLYRRRRGLLVVTELFLPAVIALAAPTAEQQRKERLRIDESSV